MNEKLMKDIRSVARARTVGKPQVAYDVTMKKVVTVDTGKVNPDGTPIMRPEQRHQHTLSEDTTEGQIKRLKRSIRQGVIRAATIRALAAMLRQGEHVPS